jgi:hypothetical protein
LASIHGVVAVIRPVQISAPCSPCRNCDSRAVCISMLKARHSLSPQLARGDPSVVRSTWKRRFWVAASSASRSQSTSVSHGRSTLPFHCEVLAFS